ncbi:MAG: hypothetical protein K2N35_09080 [Muribaculaceae bacterium]|nr:hypothetical protein [Muribaculaceae bacterium]
MKNFLIPFLFIACLFMTGCSKEEPSHEVFMQIKSIICDTGTDNSQFTYDSYGRVISYERACKNESFIITYEYVSEDLIKITTHNVIKDYTMSQDGYYEDAIRTIIDELHLEKGRAVSCDGLFSEAGGDMYSFEKKYCLEFGYTLDNLLNWIKHTEWNKSGDNWEEDRPWSWENYYYWEDGNLVKIEDYSRHSYPYITYSLKYGDTSKVQNVVPIPMGGLQYYPLQLKGFFGPMPISLITEIDQSDTSIGKHIITTYQYNLTEKRIANYIESYEGRDSNIFSVQWTK